jgi:hypothetical protein
VFQLFPFTSIVKWLYFSWIQIIFKLGLRVFLSFHHGLFFVIIKLNQEHFGILVFIKYYLKLKSGWCMLFRRARVSTSSLFGQHVRCLKMDKYRFLQRRLNLHDDPSNFDRLMWPANFRFGTDVFFSSFLFPSRILR